MRTRLTFLAAAVAICAVAAITSLATGQDKELSIHDPAQGQVIFGPSGGGLSGLAYVGGNQFLAVADSGGKLFNLTIDINTSTGLIVTDPGPELGSSIVLPRSIDLEGLEYDPASQTVIVSDEVGPRVARYRLDGTPVGDDIPIPAVFKHARNNLSLESVALGPDNAVWIVNEEALYRRGRTNDGPRASTSQGSAVRIANLATGRQWAYITDPAREVLSPAGIASGVSSMLVLPGGKVLILEREMSFGLRNRIYLVDFENATDVSSIASLDSNNDGKLDGEPWTAVGKRLLWEGFFLTTNFEGMTLGPKLDDGATTLLLISDDDQGMTQALYMLHLRGDIE